MPGRKEHILTLQLCIRILELHHTDCEKLAQPVPAGRVLMTLYLFLVKDSRLEIILTLPSLPHVQWAHRALGEADRSSAVRVFLTRSNHIG